MGSSTHSLSSVPASTYVFVESRGLVVGRSAIVAMANQLEICCAHACAIGTAAPPHMARSARKQPDPHSAPEPGRNIVSGAT